MTIFGNEVFGEVTDFFRRSHWIRLGPNAMCSVFVIGQETEKQREEAHLKMKAEIGMRQL